MGDAGDRRGSRRSGARWHRLALGLCACHRDRGGDRRARWIVPRHSIGLRRHQRPDAAHLRVRSSGDRRDGITLGHAPGRDRPWPGADTWRRDPTSVRGPGRPSPIPCGPDRSVWRRTSDAEGRAVRVQRWTRTSKLFTGGSAVVALDLASVPLIFDPDVVQKLTNLLILVILATMWNALAGYGGLVSVGQQAFIGIGAYGTVFLAGLGLSPYVAMLLAMVVAGALSVPISLLALRLRAAQFAIGMWVIAEVMSILVRLDKNLGAGTGISLIQMNQFAPNYRQAYTFWMALGFTVLFLAALFFLLRSPLGASLQAIRDDEDAARSLGVRLASRKRLLFVLAGFCFGAAGVLLASN